MGNWKHRGMPYQQLRELREQEALEANERRMQESARVAQMYAIEYTRTAQTTHLSALVAQEEHRSFGSGRVTARDRNRAIVPTPVAVIERNPVFCWACDNPLKDYEIDPEGRTVACDACSKAHEEAEQEKNAAIQARREAAIEARQAECEAWRLERYECRLQEQAELEARKGERYGTGVINLDCKSIQGDFGMDYLYNPVLQEYFKPRDHALVPIAGDLIIESGYKKEQVSGSGWVYWLLAGEEIVVVEVWEEGLFPAVIEKVEVL